jgi:2-haloacid dehalogenase
MPTPPIALFDLNGTLTDPTAIGAPWNMPELGHAVLTSALQMAMAETIVGDYHDLIAHLEQALRTEVRLRGLDEERLDDALEHAAQLPPFPDVPAAITDLADAGWRLAVLTNSGADAGRRTLAAAGLAHHFVSILGVDAVKRVKPHPDTYSYATRELNATPAELVYVASHSWDIGGAHHAGFRTVLLARRQPPSPLFPRPSLVVADANELVAILSG